MTLVLMDTRHHRTVQLFGGRSVLQPVLFRNGEIVYAEFTFQGDYLRGDPIYLQTSGPELPGDWWRQ